MIIEEMNFIRREDLRNNPHKTFIFGDNLQRFGNSGQAAHMRGEPNAVGIPTKKYPSGAPRAFFTDREYKDNCKIIDEAFQLLEGKKIIVIPKTGLGEGFSKMRYKSPQTYKYLALKLTNLMLGKL